jgi:hypothetical protein
MDRLPTETSPTIWLRSYVSSENNNRLSLANPSAGRCSLVCAAVSAHGQTACGDQLISALSQTIDDQFWCRARIRLAVSIAVPMRRMASILGLVVDAESDDRKRFWSAIRTVRVKRMLDGCSLSRLDLNPG